MANPVDIAQLSPAERLQLIEQLWESLQRPQDVEITDAQRLELERRDAAYASGEMETYSEQEVFDALKNRARR